MLFISRLFPAQFSVRLHAPHMLVTKVLFVKEVASRTYGAHARRVTRLISLLT
jgi:hypothetical protein